MRSFGAIGFIYFLIAIKLIKSELIDYVSSDEHLRAIMNKLNEIEAKVDAMDHKLKDMTNTENINVKQLIAQSVKEYEMQQTLVKMGLKIEDIGSTQHEMKAEMKALSTNFEELIAKRLEFPDNQSKTSIEELIASHVILRKNVSTVEQVTRDLNVTLYEMQSNLRSYITAKNKEIIDGLYRQTDKVITLLEDAQIDHWVPSTLMNYINETCLNKLVGNFDGLQESNRALAEHQYEMWQDLKKNTETLNELSTDVKHEIPKDLDLTVNLIEESTAHESSLLTQAQLETELRNISEEVRSLGNTLNSIAKFPRHKSSFADCTAALESFSENGVNKLYMPQSGIGFFDAYCIYNSRDARGWITIQRRFDGSVNFEQNWQAYKEGFGDLNGEHWLGLEKVYQLTSKKKHMLWIELEDFSGNKRFAMYTHFEIGNEAEAYSLKECSEFSGDAGDAFCGNTERKFTTYDVDNDTDAEKNCAVRSSGAWWFDDCNWSTLNGEYNNTLNGHGINWDRWLGFDYSLKYTHMAIRAVD